MLGLIRFGEKRTLEKIGGLLEHAPLKEHCRGIPVRGEADEAPFRQPERRRRPMLPTNTRRHPAASFDSTCPRGSPRRPPTGPEDPIQVQPNGEPVLAFSSRELDPVGGGTARGCR